MIEEKQLVSALQSNDENEKAFRILISQYK
jgi:hypothetical protein